MARLLTRKTGAGHWKTATTGYLLDGGVSVDALLGMGRCAGKEPRRGWRRYNCRLMGLPGVNSLCREEEIRDGR